MPNLFQGFLDFASGKSSLAEIDGRLGMRDLGHYAYEHKMPNWLVQLLENSEKQHVEGAPPNITDIISKVLEQDQDVESAYFCHSAVRYIGKVKVKGKNEGNHFCGYRNIQMLASYIIALKVQGFETFPDDIPTIWEIQSIIEKAWDQGLNESGRVQTGGIQGTRKHIGTPEAQALFISSKIPCRVDRFEDTKGGPTAYEQLLDSVEHYFSKSVSASLLRSSSRVQSTGLPPIYLQRPRHSMTIVGIEKRRDGFRNLLVFDPAFNPSKKMLEVLELSSTTSITEPSMSLIKSYQRGRKHLRRYHAFETVRLKVPF